MTIHRLFTNNNQLIMDAYKQILDFVLSELYNKDIQNSIKGCLFSLDDILTNKFSLTDGQKELISSILTKDGYVISSYRGNHIKLTITSYGKRFCETSSFSQPNIPIIKQI